MPREHTARVAAWAVDVAQPPTPARVITESGDAYTGLAFIRHNTVVLMLALREEPPNDPGPKPRAEDNFGAGLGD